VHHPCIGVADRAEDAIQVSQWTHRERMRPNAGRAEHQDCVHEALVPEPDVEPLGNGRGIGRVLRVRTEVVDEDDPFPRVDVVLDLVQPRAGRQVDHVVDGGVGVGQWKDRVGAARIDRRARPCDRLGELPDVRDRERAEQQRPPARPLRRRHGDDQHGERVEE
jgi:hypothetical protein